MRLHVAGVGIGVVAVAAIGCSEPSQTLPAGPRVQAAVTATSAPTCNFKTLNQLATHYFSGTETKVVRKILSSMQDSGAYSLTAKNGGFDVMAHIAQNVHDGNAGVADASNLTYGLLLCMFSDPADLPASAEDFTVATDPGTFGAYEVRGGPDDTSTAPVYSRSEPPLSGVAPDSNKAWFNVLAGNPPPSRVLLYGEPGLLPHTYDWRAVPRGTTFSPAVIVGVCIDADSNSTSLIHEEHVGLLPFRDATFLAGGCPAFGARSWSSQLASRLARWGMSVFGPRPLSATTFLNPGGLAGSTGSLRSEFGPEVVDTVALTFTTQPSDVQVNDTITPAVVVRATAVTAFGIDSVPNVSITLSAVNNNGTPAFLGGTLTRTTGADGKATFDDLFETKTGGYVLVATGTVNGRTAIVVPATTSTRFNVRP